MTDARSSQVVGVLTRENCPATSVHDLFTNAASRFAALEFLHVPHGASRAGADSPASYGTEEQLRPAQQINRPRCLRPTGYERARWQNPGSSAPR
jgi:hypothetical protein